MAIIVQKYGGTSVGTGERMLDVASIIERTRNDSTDVIAVVSAMSGKVKAEGTTSLLLKASDLAVSGQSFEEPVARIEVAHATALEAVVDDAICAARCRRGSARSSAACAASWRRCR